MDDEIETGLDDSTTETEPTSIADAALQALGMDDGADTATGVVESEDGEPIDPEQSEPEAAKVEKPSDPKAITDEDLTRPENLSHKARDRFEKLVTGYKTERTRADDAENRYKQAQESITALQDLGFKDEASGRDLVEFAKFRQALASNPQKAMEILQGQLHQMELRHGIRPRSTSAIDAFPDLVERVNGETMQYDDALEIARARQARADQQMQNQQFEQRQRQDFTQQQTTHSAIESVTQLENRWRAENPDYSAIHEHIKAEMPTIAKQFPPNQWAQQVELIYNSVQRAMSSQARQSRQQSPTPLRGNGHAASRAVPKSTAEAALIALGMNTD